MRSVLLVLTAVCAVAAHAQPQPVWVGASLGPSLVDDGVGVGGRLALHFDEGSVVIVTRATANTGGPDDIRGLLGPIRSEAFDAAVLVGPAFGEGPVRLVLGAGPGLVWGDRVLGRETGACGLLGCPVARDRIGPVPGLALEAGLHGRLGGVVGYGVVAHANVNGAESLSGLTVGLTVGSRGR